MIKLFDRIKETSHSTGTGVFNLDGAAAGFSRFNEVYSSGDVLFYAISDGTRYEIGSGVYGVNQLIQRFPFRSTNSDQLVNFPNGLKEVYVTYPAKYSVFTGSGYADFKQPQASGLAFWENANTLSYDSNIVWDKNNERLGVLIAPEYTLDVSGLARTVGNIVGNSGVLFSGNNIGYANGTQLEPFLKNVLNTETGTNAVFQLSGIVNQGWLFKQQQAGTFFAGPPSGCGSPPCPDGYPSFRGITAGDLPDLSDLYVKQYGTGVASNIALYRTSGVIEYDPFLTWDKTFNYLGVNKTNPSKALDVVGEGSFTSNVYVSGIVFSDLSLISGAYKAGSGLILDGTIFHVENLFWVSDQISSGWIKQSQTLTVSGVSGISTTFNPSTNTLLVNGGSLSASGSSYTAGSGLTLVGNEFNTAGSGNFHRVILNARNGDPQLVGNSGSQNTIVNASGFLTIPVFNNFCQGYQSIGSGSQVNKGVLFFTTDSGRMYISNGSGWMYSNFTLINEQCTGFVPE